MSREKIKNKYGMSLERTSPDPIGEDELAIWKDSAAVVRLSEFIKANRRHGIHVIIRDGRPALQFKPGLKKGNMERWNAALAAEVLLFEAADDLMKLIRKNMIELPTEAMGPFSDADPHGSAQPDQSLLLEL